MAEAHQKQEPFLRIVWLIFLLLLLVMSTGNTSHATTCTSGWGSVIGIEYVATSCPGEASTFTYKSIDLYCQSGTESGTVIRNPGTSGDYLFGPKSPAQFRSELIAEAQYYGDRFFGNSEGTRFLRVNYRFANGGSIDGKSMSAYQVAPNVHTDVFDKIIFVDPQAKPPCCLKVQTLTSSKTSFTPGGETVTFNGSIFSNYSTTWNLTVSDRVFNGSGNSASRTWDGKNSAGGIVPPGTYSASLTATTSEVECTNVGTVEVEVKAPPKEICDGIDNNGNDLVDEGCWGKGCLNVNNGVKR